MVKNAKINTNLESESKKKLMKKAESYGSLSNFLEEIANKTIIIVTPEVAQLFKLMGKNINLPHD